MNRAGEILSETAIEVMVGRTEIGTGTATGIEIEGVMAMAIGDDMIDTSTNSQFFQRNCIVAAPSLGIHFSIITGSQSPPLQSWPPSGGLVR